MKALAVFMASVGLLLFVCRPLHGADAPRQSARGEDAKVPAWGPPVGLVRAGLTAEKPQFASGDRDWIKLVLDVRNEGPKKVVFSGAGAEHGWLWRFDLVVPDSNGIDRVRTFSPTGARIANPPYFSPKRRLTLGWEI